VVPPSGAAAGRYSVASAFDELLEDPRLWRAGRPARERGRAVAPTGHAALDALLPGGGWPLGALIELLGARRGSGELGLLMPALAGPVLAGRPVAFIGAPHPPYAPALAARGLDPARLFCVEVGEAARAVWAAEQALETGACGVVLLWLDRAPMRQLRRLQLAAGGGDALAVLLRPAGAARRPSPAPLRVLLEPAPGGVSVRVLKARGGRGGVVTVPMES